MKGGWLHVTLAPLVYVRAMHTMGEEPELALQVLERSSPRSLERKRTPYSWQRWMGFISRWASPRRRYPSPTAPAWFTGLQCGNPWFMAAEWRAREWCASKPPDHGRFPLFFSSIVHVPYSIVCNYLDISFILFSCSPQNSDCYWNFFFASWDIRSRFRRTSQTRTMSCVLVLLWFLANSFILYLDTYG